MFVQRTNQFLSVSLEHTLFLDFLKLFVNMHLAISFVQKINYIFWTYGSKVMGVWSFKEKSGQGGHLLEPTCKSWPPTQKVEGRKKKNFKKNGTTAQVHVSTCSRQVTAGRQMLVTSGRGPPAVGRHLRGCTCRTVHIFLNFFKFKTKEFL